MNSYEVVERTLRFQKPDRIPRHLWILPSAYLAHGQDFISNDWPQVIRIAKRMEIMMRETSLVQ